MTFLKCRITFVIPELKMFELKSESKFFILLIL